jgi:hypothetical protein
MFPDPLIWFPPLLRFYILFIVWKRVYLLIVAEVSKLIPLICESLLLLLLVYSGLIFILTTKLLDLVIEL